MSIRIKESDPNSLLKKTLLCEYNIKDYEIEYTSNGKPFLLNNNVYFNYSKNDNITALVTSNKNVGICIKNNFYDEDIIDNYFTDKEKNLLYNSKNKNDTFMRIITLKIAFLKMKNYPKDYNIKNIDTLSIIGYETVREKDYFVSVVYDN